MMRQVITAVIVKAVALQVERQASLAIARGVIATNFPRTADVRGICVMVKDHYIDCEAFGLGLVIAVRIGHADNIGEVFGDFQFLDSFAHVVVGLRMRVSQIHTPLSRGGDFADDMVRLHERLVLQFLQADGLHGGIHGAFVQGQLHHGIVGDVVGDALMRDVSQCVDGMELIVGIDLLAMATTVGDEVVASDVFRSSRQFLHLGMLGSLLDVGVNLLFDFVGIVAHVILGG